MGQMGFFDLGNRYSGLDAKNEPLLKIDGVVPWEDLRASRSDVVPWEDCVLRRCGGVRTRRVNRGRDASRGMRL